MTDVLRAIILGIVQGLTEFLPVSSTGHLVIAEAVLGVSQQDYGLRFDAAIHLGTLAAVLLYFRATLLPLAGAWFESLRSRDWDVSPQSRLAWLLIIGTIPAGIAGYFIQDLAEDAFREPALVGAMLILFSAPMIVAEKLGRQKLAVGDTTPLMALLLGVAQSLALVPGVSRSGITIAAGMLAGFRREEAAAFAFMLSAPIIAAAGGKQIFDILRGDAGASSLQNEYLVYGAGMVTAAVVGYAAIAFLVRYLRTNPLYVFVGYRMIFGVIVLGLAAAGVL